MRGLHPSAMFLALGPATAGSSARQASPVTTPDVPPGIKDLYHRAIAAALERCAPMRFTTGLDGAVADQSLSIRFVDNREQP